MNTQYVLWFAAFVVVAGASLLWLAMGDIPEVMSEPEADPEPETASESAGQDGFAGPA